MKKYFKVNVHSENIDLEIYNQCIIVERGLLYAKEIATNERIMICDNKNERIMICDNKTQGSMYDYYVLSNDFKTENIVRYAELKKYIDNFNLSMFPMYSNLESKQVKKLVKNINKGVDSHE